MTAKPIGASSFSRRAKRVMDLCVAVPVFAASLPMQAAVAVAIRRDLGKPVMFRQPRPGLNGEIFELRKFRTMRDVDSDRGLIDDASRLTPLGRWLRSTSLDELPTLWSVIAGDMSLVGPRPLLPQYLSRYSATEARRHEVRPGITGLAQVRGRNSLSWPEKLALDVEYVDTMSLRGDVRILAETVLTVFRRTGIAHGDTATMPEFMGERARESASA